MPAPKAVLRAARTQNHPVAKTTAQKPEQLKLFPQEEPEAVPDEPEKSDNNFLVQVLNCGLKPSKGKARTQQVFYTGGEAILTGVRSKRVQ
jgi:hypothetical protein